jgi:hypothetical protein
MPITREKSKLAASKQVNTRVDDNATGSNEVELGVVGQGEQQDSLDTQDQMQQNLSDAEQVRGLEADQIHSSDTGSCDEHIGSQQSQNSFQSSSDHSSNIQKNVIIVEIDGVSLPMSTQEFLSFKQTQAKLDLEREESQAKRDLERVQMKSFIAKRSRPISNGLV